MIEEQEKAAEDLLNANDDSAFVAFILLRAICTARKPKKINPEEMYFIYKNYSLLLSERKKMEGYKQRLEALNHFWGVR